LKNLQQEIEKKNQELNKEKIEKEIAENSLE
jgi:hypothetical protein